jgi:hypothetical protein
MQCTKWSSLTHSYYKCHGFFFFFGEGGGDFATNGRTIINILLGFEPRRDLLKFKGCWQAGKLILLLLPDWLPDQVVSIFSSLPPCWGRVGRAPRNSVGMMLKFPFWLGKLHFLLKMLVKVIPSPFILSPLLSLFWWIFGKQCLLHSLVVRNTLLSISIVTQIYISQIKFPFFNDFWKYLLHNYLIRFVLFINLWHIFAWCVTHLWGEVCGFWCLWWFAITVIYMLLPCSNIKVY